MNLIEQLGGYEKAKEKMDDICHTLDNSELLGGGDAREGLYERLESIDKALLEYRRQHNIYEVGDKVVSTLNGDDFWMNIICVIDGFHKSMIITKGGGHVIHHYEFRHATDEEIAAGKRLEVK